MNVTSNLREIFRKNTECNTKVAGNGRAVLLSYPQTEKRRERNGIWRAAPGGPQTQRADAGGICRTASGLAPVGLALGIRPGLPRDGEDHLHLQPLRCDDGRAVQRRSPHPRRAAGRSPAAVRAHARQRVVEPVRESVTLQQKHRDHAADRHRDDRSGIRLLYAQFERRSR